MQTEPEQQPAGEAVSDCDISDLDLSYSWDASEMDSESDVEHALAKHPSYRSRQSEASDSSEDTWDSDDLSDSSSSYSDESDASDASDESDSSSVVSGEEKASDTLDTIDIDDDALLWDLQSQCTCRCAVHAPEVRAVA